MSGRFTEAAPEALARSLHAYRLVLRGHKLRGNAGALLGQRSGSSIEFQDFRSYVMGDDPRHIDWSVYARTRSLTVRLYRDEVRPHLDIVLDTSRSMGLTDGTKSQLARSLAVFAWHSGRQQGFISTLYAAGTQTKRCQHPDELNADGRSCQLFEAPKVVAHQLAHSGVRLVISDFLAPTSPREVLRALAQGASQLIVLMTLGPWEADPPRRGLLTLVDAETGREQVVNLSARSTERYRERLAHLRSEVQGTCRKLGARFAEVICNANLEHTLRATLLSAQVVEPL